MTLEHVAPGNSEGTEPDVRAEVRALYGRGPRDR